MDYRNDGNPVILHFSNIRLFYFFLFFSLSSPGQESYLWEPLRQKTQNMTLGGVVSVQTLGI